jgi:hypothetical protein
MEDCDAKTKLRYARFFEEKEQIEKEFQAKLRAWEKKERRFCITQGILASMIKFPKLETTEVELKCEEN